jgi:hypothetical protein
MNYFFSLIYNLFLKALILQAFQIYVKTYNLGEIHLIIPDSV